MATRNRTELFKEYRDEFKSNAPASLESLLNDDDENALLGSSDVVVQMGGSKPPKWLPLIDEVRYEISDIEKSLLDLEELHSDHLLVRFGDDDKKEQEIQILTAEITRKFQDMSKKLKSLGGKEGGGKEEEMKGNVRATLANQLQQLSQQFKKKQREYLEKVRGRQDSGDNDLFPFEQAEQLPEDLIGYDRGFTQDQVDVMTTAHARQMGRSKEIQDISKSIVELAEIMNDLRVLVEDQGTILDRIDYNIEQVEEMTEESLTIIQDSHEQQKKSRTKTCMMGLCVMVLVLCIVLILKFIIRSL